jgi:hypothetical protein
MPARLTIELHERKILVLFTLIKNNAICQPNARHHRPRIQCRQRQVLQLKAALFAAGCMP